MSSIASPITSPTATPATQTPPAASPPADPLGNESTFLRLLVSQLQNQDPLNPTDSTQFVSQLTSYSQLEQLINIDQNTTPASGAAPGATGTDPVTSIATKATA
ncbi:MAG TPA: flagellar hook capping FlgD N-terminal domain-containing protein [Bryobacteraceae bacterium]|jgi:flagellar basal-body rod modification protein FlgD|nr:flagellar hook capping FlgD N-terminal domain-containing protein [Bryobacteraceae bacterium]